MPCKHINFSSSQRDQNPFSSWEGKIMGRKAMVSEAAFKRQEDRRMESSALQCIICPTNAQKGSVIYSICCISLIPIPMIKAEPLFMDCHHIWDHNLYLCPKQHLPSKPQHPPIRSLFNSNTSSGFFNFTAGSSP